MTSVTLQIVGLGKDITHAESCALSTWGGACAARGAGRMHPKIQEVIYWCGTGTVARGVMVNPMVQATCNWEIGGYAGGGWGGINNPMMQHVLT